MDAGRVTVNKLTWLAIMRERKYDADRAYRNAIIAARADGHSYRAIGEVIGTDGAAVYRMLKRADH